MDYFKGVVGEEDCKKRFKELAKVHHPDVGGDPSVMKEINSQFDKIKNKNFVKQEHLFGGARQGGRSQAARNMEDVFSFAYGFGPKWDQDSLFEKLKAELRAREAKEAKDKKIRQENYEKFKNLEVAKKMVIAAQLDKEQLLKELKCIWEKEIDNIYKAFYGA